jgi:hypothetical protein
MRSSGKFDDPAVGRQESVSVVSELIVPVIAPVDELNRGGGWAAVRRRFTRDKR